MNFFASTVLLLNLILLNSLTFAGPLELYFQKFQEKQPALLTDKNIKETQFAQLIDHENPQAGTFAQRYFLDESLSNQENAPVFLYICGEGECSKRHLNGAIRHYAQKYHAKLIALEHRYYGQSLPVNSFTTDNLRYLSTTAALEDLAYFQQKISQQHHWTGKWVAFGGSYAGSLAAYYRLKYPELVVGALASSGPVMAKEDFIEYDQHVTQVAGATCAKQMRKVVKEVEASLKDPKKLHKMKELFSATDVQDPKDFLYLIADTGATAIQYGMRDKFCTYLETRTNPVKGYADFANYVYKLLNITAVEITAQGAINEEIDGYTSGVGMRQWYYQSCKEYGYWQNAHPNPSESTRSSLINLDYHQQICSRLFGITEPADTQNFNNHYYLPLMDESVTNIYFTNGSTDPWSKLSISEENGNTTNANLTYELIQGAAHCDDLGGPTGKDSDAIVQAREKMDQLLMKWLQ
ncbi:MAG: septum formation initiator [Legionella sp.]|nr:MAG: septum formation initiator [Legionella sp.]